MTKRERLTLLLEKCQYLNGDTPKMVLEYWVDTIQDCYSAGAHPLADAVKNHDFDHAIQMIRDALGDKKLPTCEPLYYDTELVRDSMWKALSEQQKIHLGDNTLESAEHLLRGMGYTPKAVEQAGLLVWDWSRRYKKATEEK